MAKILAPNKQYNGISASVTFVNGEGHTEDLKLIAWFKQRGYEVVEKKQTKPSPPPPKKAQDTKKEGE